MHHRAGRVAPLLRLAQRTFSTVTTHHRSLQGVRMGALLGAMVGAKPASGNRALQGTGKTGGVAMLSTAPSAGSSGLVISDFGDPEKVLVFTDSLNPVTASPESVASGNTLELEYLAAPINPADVNMVEGVYATLPSVPSVGGNEGVARVVGVGPGVAEDRFAVGDWVVPDRKLQGTWRTDAVVDADAFLRVPVPTGAAAQTLSVAQAATLTVNPCTAYRMLHDFVDLRPGDTVLQNGGHSGVGKAVVQIAHALGVRTISVIRDSPDDPATEDTQKARLAALGADVVLTEREASGRDMESIVGDAPPVLALNCVGGRSSVTLGKWLAQGGTMVTYGGMSKRPVTVPTGFLIFKDLAVRGFWMTRWAEEATVAQRTAMYQSVVDLMAQGSLEVDVNEYPLTADAVPDAIHFALHGRGGKALLCPPSPSAL